MAVDYDKIDEELEEKMPSKYVFLPKMGEEATYEIVEVAKMEHEKLNISFNRDRVIDGETLTSKESLGFYLGCILKSEQILVVNNIAVYRLFSDAKVTDGHKICVKHPGKGQWNIDILEEA